MGCPNITGYYDITQKLSTSVFVMMKMWPIEEKNVQV